MRKATLGIAGAITLMVAAPVLWMLARQRGASEPRLILASGQTTMNDVPVKANQPVAQGAQLSTGLMSIACFGVHTTRVCLGANTSMRLAAIGAASAALDVQQGTIVVGTSGEQELITVPGGSLQVSQGIVAIEVSSREVIVRAYEGSVGMTAGSASAATVAAPAVLNLEGKKRMPIPPLEAEERAMITMARAWQGGGGTVQISGTHGRVVVDGLGLGRPPVSVLLASGPHTVLLREGDQELLRKTVDVSSGQNVDVSE